MARATARKGPVTGAAERPSRSTPETRKADKDQRDARRGARQALKALHAVERQLLEARLAGDLAADMDRVGARLRSVRAVVLVAITTRFQDRRLGLSESLSPTERAAALQRITLDEAVEIAVLNDRLHQQELRDRQETALAARRTRRVARVILRRRQRHESAVVAIRLSTARPWRGYGLKAVTPLRAIRKLEVRRREKDATIT